MWNGRCGAAPRWPSRIKATSCQSVMKRWDSMHIDVYPMHMNAQISNNTFGFSLRFVMFVMFARDEISETFLVFFKSRCFFLWKFFHAQVVFFSFISGTLGLSLYSYMAGMNVCILVLFFMKSFCNRRCGREHLEIISADFHQIVYSMRHRSLQNLYP